MNKSIGSWVTLNNPSIAEIMADAGFDWLCVDMEHSVTDYAEAQQLILAIQSKGIKAYVRVGENNPRIIKRILDAGADGIIVPSVNSAADAKKAVNAVKYPPFGNRGVGLARAQDYGFGFEKYKEEKAKNIKLIAQIEHINAIRELDAIIQTEGIGRTEMNSNKVRLYRKFAYLLKRRYPYLNIYLDYESGFLRRILEPKFLYITKSKHEFNVLFTYRRYENIEEIEDKTQKDSFGDINIKWV